MIKEYPVTVKRDFYKFNEETGKIDRRIEEITYTRTIYTTGLFWEILRATAIIFGLFLSPLSACLCYDVLHWHFGFSFVIGIVCLIIFSILYWRCDSHEEKLDDQCTTNNEEQFSQAIQYMTKDGWTMNKKVAEEERDEWVKSRLVKKLKNS